MATSIVLDSADSLRKPVQCLISHKHWLKRKLNRQWKAEPEPGVIYIAHIPHGFYEDQMKEYFSQFGTVTKVKLARSRKTGKSKGYAFVEFEHAEVAEVVAETMNNYILFNRLLKVEYVPQEKITSKNFWRTNITEKSYPRLKNRKRSISKKNAKKSEKEVDKLLKNKRKHIESIITKLSTQGISYSMKEFDAPTPVPQLPTPVPVLEIDESDEEIEFRIRPDFILKRKIINKTTKSVSKKLKNNSSESDLAGSGNCKSPEPKLHLMNVKKNLFGENQKRSPKTGKKSGQEAMNAILSLSSDSIPSHSEKSSRNAASGKKSKRLTEETSPTADSMLPPKLGKQKIKKIAEKFSARLQKKLKRTTVQQDADESATKFTIKTKLGRKSTSTKPASDRNSKLSAKKLKINGKLQMLTEMGM